MASEACRARRRERLLLGTELLLLALACLGAVGTVGLARGQRWLDGVILGDLAGVEARCGRLFPPGSTLITGRYWAGLSPAAAVVVRVPGPPSSVTADTEPGDARSPMAERWGRDLPGPSSLGLHGPPLWAHVSLDTESEGVFDVWELWLYEDGDATVVYGNWWMVP